MSVEAAHARGLDSVLTLQQSARNFEAKLKTERWTKDSPEWIQASKSSCEQAYDKAIDKLESLVVARVFELSKMNHAGTGQLNSILLSRYESKILNYRIQASKAHRKQSEATFTGGEDGSEGIQFSSSKFRLKYQRNRCQGSIGVRVYWTV